MKKKQTLLSHQSIVNSISSLQHFAIDCSFFIVAFVIVAISATPCHPQNKIISVLLLIIAKFIGRYSC